jgi:SnoaL-like polyketide cyclase
MSKEQENKAVVARWFKEFWGNPWDPGVVDELSTPDILLQYSLHAPRRGRQDVKEFMTEFRRAFPDLKFWGVADLIAEGDHVVGRWEGGGTHTGPAFSDFLMGSLPAASGRKMRSPERQCCACRRAGSPRKSGWTMAQPRCSSSASCEQLSTARWP